MSREDWQAGASGRSADLSGDPPVTLGSPHDRDPGQSPEDAEVSAPSVAAAAAGGTTEDAAARRSAARRGAPHAARFALTKFRPMTLPATLLARPTLFARLEAGASHRLTVVAGSAGAGKSTVLLGWAAMREGGGAAWLS